jgi:hypothetical protein
MHKLNDKKLRKNHKQWRQGRKNPTKKQWGV